MDTHNLCFWAEIWKISVFIWKFQFIEVNFSIYLNRLKPFSQALLQLHWQGGGGGGGGWLLCFFFGLGFHHSVCVKGDSSVVFFLSLCVSGFIFGVCFVIVCSLSRLLFVTREGWVSWLWHLPGIFTYVFVCQSWFVFCLLFLFLSFMGCDCGSSGTHYKNMPIQIHWNVYHQKTKIFR